MNKQDIKHIIEHLDKIQNMHEDIIDEQKQAIREIINVKHELKFFSMNSH